MQNPRNIIGSVLFAVLWAVVAAWRPGSTFHLAPVIVAAWPAINEPRLEKALPISVIGFAIAVAMTVLLGIGELHGPSLLPGVEPEWSRSWLPASGPWSGSPGHGRRSNRREPLGVSQ